MEIYIERPETSNQSDQLIYSYNPDDENRGPFSIFLREDFEARQRSLEICRNAFPRPRRAFVFLSFKFKAARHPVAHAVQLLD